MWFAWGQPERNSGRFYEINFGRSAHRWDDRRFDSRTSRFPNKQLIAQYLTDFGEDSDIGRVRVLGLPPMADELPFIEWARILVTQQRQVVTFDDEPLVAGFDASGGGAAWNVVRFRRGLDARSIPPVRVPGEHSRDRSGLIAGLAEIMREQRPGAQGCRHVRRLRFRSPVRRTAATSWVTATWSRAGLPSVRTPLDRTRGIVNRKIFQSSASDQVSDILHVFARPGLEAELIAVLKRARAGEAGPHGLAPPLPPLVMLHSARDGRARAHEGHVAADDIPSPGQLVQGKPRDVMTEARRARGRPHEVRLIRTANRSST
jgi:hypothetical protein